MSHEIRTPMNAIIGMTDLALQTTTHARSSARYMQTAQGVGRGAADDHQRHPRLLEDRGAASSTLDRVPFACATPSRTASSCLRRAPTRRGWSWPAASRRTCPTPLVGDPGRLRQILINLVGNAIKFTDAGEVVVDVAVAEQHARRRVRCSSPCATPASAFPPTSSWEIFGAFVQADASTTRRYGGTGLGLTISSQLVELMGGRIWLESEAGHGQHVPLRGASSACSRESRRAGAVARILR